MKTTEPGQSAERTRVVTSRDIELFTEITGDRNPIHYDAELASRPVFDLSRLRQCSPKHPRLRLLPISIV